MALKRRSSPSRNVDHESGGEPLVSSSVEQSTTLKVLNSSKDNMPVGTDIVWSDFSTSASSNPEVKWLIDLRTNYPRISSSAESNFLRVFGWHSEILKTGRWGFVAVVHPEDRDRVLYELTMDRSSGSQVDFRIVDSAGEERQLRLSWKWLEDKSWVEFHAWDLTDGWLVERCRLRELYEQKLLLSLKSRLPAREFAGLMSVWLVPGECIQQSASWAEIEIWLRDVWGRRYEAQRIDWKLSVDGDVSSQLEVVGPKEVILLAFSELMRNASEAISSISKRDSNWISMDVHFLDDSLIIGIEDSGPGVSLVNRGKLFHPYFTTKDQSKHMGLGLYIVRQISEALQGGVRFDQFSAKSRFALQLPLRRR
jgi:hypothetical protein